MLKTDSFYFEGDDRVVILFHAFTSSAVDNRMLGRFLNKAGYTVYGHLFQAHGTDDVSDVLEVNPAVWFEDGKEAVEQMHKRGYHKIAVMGVSLGGIVSMQTFLDDSTILGVGTLCSPMISGYWTNTPKDFWNRYLTEQEAKGVSQEIIEAKRGEISQGVQRVLAHLDERKNAMYLQYNEVKRPVFIAQGAKDRTIDPKQAIELQYQFTDAPVNFKWYRESGHLITLGPERKDLFDDILHYFEGLAW